MSGVDIVFNATHARLDITFNDDFGDHVDIMPILNDLTKILGNAKPFTAYFHGIDQKIILSDTQYKNAIAWLSLISVLIKKLVIKAIIVDPTGYVETWLPLIRSIRELPRNIVCVKTVEGDVA